MHRSVQHNLRLAILVLAIMAGVVLEKQAHQGQHADCEQCIKASAVL